MTETTFAIKNIFDATQHFILAQQRQPEHKTIKVGEIILANKITKRITPEKKPPFTLTICNVVLKRFINRFGALDYYYYYIIYRDKMYRNWAREDAYNIPKYEKEDGVTFQTDIIRDIQDNGLEGNSAIVLITNDSVIRYVSGNDMFDFMRKYSWFIDKFSQQCTGFGKSMMSIHDPFLSFMG